jgi:3'(2'), 5'-bisphosphate nucleotidase
MTDDHALAARIAQDCGVVLLDLRSRGVDGGARALGAEGDRRSNEALNAALADARPLDAVLSEEGGSAPGRPDRAQADRVWVVDPLDGTREYSEGRSDFAVHVALVVAGQPVAGAVALPGEGLVFATGGRSSSGAGPGARQDNGPGAGPGPAPGPGADAGGTSPVRVAVSRTRPPDEATLVETRLGAELVPMGSAGAKAMAVVRGTVDAYIHAGGQYEWDSAAPVAVARAHGLHASRLDGSPLVYNRPDPWLPDLLVCRTELVDAILEALRT